jgi:hypothetical protein
MPLRDKRDHLHGKKWQTVPRVVAQIDWAVSPLRESATPQTERDPSSVHFWTYRGWQDPPLRTNKQVFHSRIFLAAHVGGAVAMIVAWRSTHSGESLGSEVPAVTALFGMDYLQFRFVDGPNAIGPAIYEMIHYSRASTR